MTDIRPLSSEDAPAASTIHKASFETGWSAQALGLHIADDLALGIYDGALIGFILMKFAGDQADILTIAIESKARQKGLGRALLTSAENHAAQRGISIMFLEVAEDNHAAIALYSRAGYQPIGKRPAYYKRAKGRVAALTYRKEIDTPR